MIEQKEISSSNGGPELFLKFVNQSERTVKIDWINDDGDLVNYSDLNPGETYD